MMNGFRSLATLTRGAPALVPPMIARLQRSTAALLGYREGSLAMTPTPIWAAPQGLRLQARLSMAPVLVAGLLALLFLFSAYPVVKSLTQPDLRYMMADIARTAGAGPVAPAPLSLQRASTQPRPLSPLPAGAQDGPYSIHRHITIGRDGSLSRALQDLDLPVSRITPALAEMATFIDLRAVKAGMSLSILLGPPAEGPQGRDRPIERLSLWEDERALVRLQREEGFGLRQREDLPAPLPGPFQAAWHGTGQIDRSLYSAAQDMGLTPELTGQFTKIFQYDVDFAREIQKGDEFEVLLANANGDTQKEAHIAYAALHLRGRSLHYFRYASPDGEVRYFDENGRGMTKALMRTPVDGARMTSGFGPRHHPLLGFTRMHQGVDFAAPTGTPVFAAADGKVVEAGPKGSFGNFIRIDHGNGYQTAYAHLHGFRSGLKKGTRVRQGQIIGTVGASGRATGPHLHFEVHRRGKPVNPLTVSPNQNYALTGAALQDFKAHVEELRALTVAARPLKTIRTAQIPAEEETSAQ